MEKVIIGMSGGVDSSVAAAVLLEQGYDVIGVTLRLQDGAESDTAVQDAERVAKHLQIPFHVLDFRDRFSHCVIDYFTQEYLSGRTPNPCIACNRHIKFCAMLEAAGKMGADKIATGHYARVEFDKASGRYLLKRCAASVKDQTYALYALDQAQLSKVLMPLGAFPDKAAVRQKAQALHLPVAEKPESMEIGGGGGGMFGGSGANLNYTDDDLDSYSSIWEGSVTDTTDSDHKVIVTALKNISEGSNLEQYMDIDNLLRYAAVHIFSVNSDSLSGSMAHNYYLYESDGQLNLLPWDYNLAFGGMGGMGGRDNTDSDSATNIVNSPIDDAWNATEFFDTLLADESYHHAYYSYMEQVADYILNGGFESFYHHTRSLIDSLVETDPTAFYTYDEYLSAVETFYEVVTLRGESIQGQLEGTIPSTDQEQQGSDALVDASHIDLNVMGSMDMGNMGGGNFNFGGMDFGGFSPAQNNQNTVPETSDESDSLQSDAANSTQNMNRITSLEEGSEMAPSNENATESNSSSQTDTDLPENFDPSQSGGEPPEDFDASQFNGELPENFGPSQFFGQMPGNFESSDTSDDNAGESEVPETDEGNGNAEEEERNQGQQPPDIGNLPNRGDIFGSNTNQTGTSSKSALFYYGIAIGIMLAAFLFAMFYHRKPRKR